MNFNPTIKSRVREVLPARVRYLHRVLHHAPGDLRAALSFFSDPSLLLSRRERLALLRSFVRISLQMHSPHTEAEILTIVSHILSLPDCVNGCIVEAGAFKGSSTAKLSHAAARAGRDMVVFDSFEGLPDDVQPPFKPGNYCGTLDEVRAHVRAYGRPERCSYIKGWFEETLPNFDQPIAAAFVDVDLATSVRTCLRFLYPLLSPGGTIFSHDGHIGPVVEVFRDTVFWENEVGFPRPDIEGLGHRKLLKVVKESTDIAAEDLVKEGAG